MSTLINIVSKKLIILDFLNVHFLLSINVENDDELEAEFVSSQGAKESDFKSPQGAYKSL